MKWYECGGCEIFIQRLENFLSTLMLETGDYQLSEITLKPKYFDETRAYLLDRYRTLNNEPINDIVSINYNTQWGTIVLKRGSE